MIGNNIRQLRNEKGMTQKELADQLFVTAQAVSRWENDEVEPSISTIAQMAGIFHVTSDQILGMSTEKEENAPAAPGEPKPVLAVCEICNRPIYDGNEIVREFVGDEKQVICTSCRDARAEKIKKEQKHRAAVCRRRSYIFGGLLGILFLILTFAVGDPKTYAVGVVMSVLAFTWLSCLLLNNNFIGDITVSIAEWGAIRMPGLIFELDLDGILWLITVKLIFFVIGVLLSIASLILALCIGSVLSVFTYPFALRRSFVHPEKNDE